MKIKEMFVKWGAVVASLALFFGVTSAGTMCMAWFHQPKVPAKLLHK